MNDNLDKNGLKSLTDATFYDFVNHIWRNIPNVDKSEKAYYVSLDAFTREGRFGIDLRTQLQLEYMIGMFSFKSKQDILYRAYKNLEPSASMTDYVLSNICLLYNEPVQRSIKNDYIDLIQYDDYLHKLHKIGKYNGNILAFVGWKDKKIHLQTITKGWYNWVEKEKDVWELWLPFPVNRKQKMYIDNPQDVLNSYEFNYHVWTDKEYKLVDFNGRVINQEPNIYKTIPFVEVDFSSNNRYDYIDNSSGMYDLLLDQLKQNLLAFNITTNATYSNIAFLHLDNMQIKSGSSFGIGSVIETTTNEGDPEPRAEFIVSPSNFTELDSYKENHYKEVLRKHSIPKSIIEGGGVMSGEALKIDRIGLEEVRKADIKVMEYFEKKISAMIDIVSKRHGTPYNFGDYTITYNSLDYEGDAKAKYDLAREKLNNNDIDIYSYLRDIGYIGDEKELKRIYIQNLKVNNEFRELARGTDGSTNGKSRPSNPSTDEGEIVQRDIQDDTEKSTDDNPTE